MRLALCVFTCVVGTTVSWGQEPKLVHVLKGHKSSVRVVVFSPDSSLLASSQDGGEVRLWDVDSGKNLSVLYEGGDCYESLTFSPDGMILAGGHDCRWVSLWDVAKRTHIGTVAANSRFPRRWPAVGFLRDSKTMVWRSCDSDDYDSDNHEITLTNVATLTKTDAVKVNIGRYGCMAFSADCRLFAVGNLKGGGADNPIVLHETVTGKKLVAIKGGNDLPADLTFSPDGRTLAAAIGGTVKLWAVATGKHISTFALSNPTSTYPGVKGSFANDVCGVAFSPDGRTIAFGNSGEPVVELWNVATGKKMYALKGNPLSKGDGIDSIAISPDGRMLAAGRFAGSGNWDETIELWNIGNTNTLK